MKWINGGMGVEYSIKGQVQGYKIFNWNSLLQGEIEFRNHCLTYPLLILWLCFDLLFLFRIGFQVSNFYFSFLSFSVFRIKIEELSQSKIKRRFMAKRKDARVTVILECTSCIRTGVKKVSRGISRYITQKNRHNTPNRLELLKFCPYCNKHTIHGEIKK